MSGAVALAGFVLVGGQSLRMGTNKALLDYHGVPLALYIAEKLKEVTENVSLVGDPVLYGHLGLPVVRDREVGRGPLSGIEAALNSDTAEEWNLIAACDMPSLNAGLFIALQRKAAAAGSEIDCIVPVTGSVTGLATSQASGGKLQPLCAAYRRRCGTVVTMALENGTRRVVDVLAMLQAEVWPAEDAQLFQNVNTRPEWIQFLRGSQAVQPHDRRISTLS